PAGTDPGFETGMLEDWGGVTPVIMISSTSPALDMGGGRTGHEQRGRFFVSAFDYTGTGAMMPPSDIGAVERQLGVFQVDELYDEPPSESQSAGIYQIVDINAGLINILPGNLADPDAAADDPYTSLGDFTIREAINYARLNGEPSVITFYTGLATREFE